MENKTHTFERRQALKLALGVAALAPGAGAFAAQCIETPKQPEGPFYPVDEQLDTDADLTSVTGVDGKASGQIVYIEGTVKDRGCTPIADVLIEIWQASSLGRYKHPDDHNAAPLDPFFQYWGRTKTDANGQYRFKTVVPGAYSVDTGEVRTPHIHFKVTRPSFVPLTTQMYFAGQALNSQDFLLSQLSAAERKKLTVQLQEAPAGFEAHAKVGTFNITLEETLRS